MKIAQAKRIPLEDLLERLGHAPQRRTGGQLWYLSPFRPEKTPSFKVNRDRNLWYDFGDGRHGDAVDLVQELENLPSVGAALRRLETWEGMAPCAADFRNETDFRDEPAIPAKPAIELLDIGPVRSAALRQYLRRRGVDPGLAVPYVQEARYRVGDRERFALAFANDAGGYELRNPFSQLTLGS